MPTEFVIFRPVGVEFVTRNNLVILSFKINLRHSPEISTQGPNSTFSTLPHYSSSFFIFKIPPRIHHFPHPPRCNMDPDAEILLDCSPMFRQYKSGRVERLMGTETIPPGLDPATGVNTKDATISPDLSARLYIPELPPSSKLPVLLYLHGGGFCIGSAFNPNPFLHLLVSRARLLVVSVDYRLAPEHPLPAAYDDCWAAIEWVMSHASGGGSEAWLAEHGDFSRVFVMGESAGANIAHHMALRAGDEGKPFEGMVLGHPYFWGSEPVGSETRDPTVMGRVEGLWRVANKAGVDVDHPWMNPMAEGAPSLAGLGCKRLMVCVAGKDVLVERGRAYAEAVKGSGWGGAVELVESEEEEHVFFYLKPECAKAAELLEYMVAFFQRRNLAKKDEDGGLASSMKGKVQSQPGVDDKGKSKETQIKMKLDKPKFRQSQPKFFMRFGWEIKGSGGEVNSYPGVSQRLMISGNSSVKALPLNFLRI